jgi:thioredoxin reductase
VDPTLPVAVIGAGPVGLAAMAHLVTAGEEPIAFEAADRVGAAVGEWGHVRLFTPWALDLDGAATALLVERGWAGPDPGAHPTGAALVERYLAPLAALPALAARLHLGTRVVTVTRLGLDKAKTAARPDAPFVLRVVDTHGERDVLAKAVVDASGTWSTPNPVGAAGVPAIGEPGAAGRIRYGIPDVLGAERSRYAGRRVLVVGSGHSAFNSISDLATLAADEPGTTIHWALRRPSLAEVLGAGAPDVLPERARLAAQVQALAAAGTLHVHPGVRIDRVEPTDGALRMWAAGELVADVDEVVGATGFRPDRTLLGELRTALDPALDSPAALAPLIDPNVHNCGSVPPHGARELAHPDEPGLFIVGMKSYGRAPTALLATAYEQVRSVVAAIAGDWDAARDVRLVLPGPDPCASGAACIPVCG